MTLTGAILHVHHGQQASVCLSRHYDAVMGKSLSQGIFHVFLCSCCVFKVLKHIKSKMSESPGYFRHRFNSTGGSLSLPGCTGVFHVSPPPPTRVLLDVCTLLQLSLGLNFGIGLFLPVDWRRRESSISRSPCCGRSRQVALRDSIFFSNLV